MKIGYSVEGSTDRALVMGLQKRWCPDANLAEGKFRGATRTSRTREIPQICLELHERHAVDLIVFLCDANKEDWRDVLKKEEARCPEKYRHLTLFGVCDRNAESWLCMDKEWLAQRTGQKPDVFSGDDFKPPFARAMGITGTDKKEAEIATLVEQAPLKSWLGNKSFADFYEKLRRFSQQRGCRLENLREG